MTETISPPAEPRSRAEHAAKAADERRIAVMLAALGVVFGDIGTSPLYALKECFHGEHAVAVTPANVLGVLSLVFWALTLVVAIKYVTFVMRADNRGEGGILALLALVPDDQRSAQKRKGPGVVALLVLFGAALLYGDGVITPAISVLSAVEGVEAGGVSELKPLAIPLTVVILVVLFLMQKHGTARVGRVFGPVMLLWFFTIAALGVRHIVEAPEILTALSPHHAIRFFLENRGTGFLVLGAIVLVLTGAEAIYADMGHFGRLPIKRAWFAIVMPAVLLNYFGQGAYVLQHPEAAAGPFYSLAPRWALYPTIVIATAAAIVASQAVITGAYSLTQQAVQLGFFPRISIVHTSKETEGQIYVPEINAMLLVLSVGLVLQFKTSDAMAAAYGIAVTGTMTITSIVYYVVATRAWKWPWWKAAPLAGWFIAVDFAFFSASWAKFLDGGWFPVALAAAIFTVMTTWNKGRRYLGAELAQQMLPLSLFLEDIERTKPTRVAGTAVFMASNPNGVPPILLHHFKHNQCLHSQIVLLNVASLHVPEVPHAERSTVEDLGHGFFRVTLRYGFMQHPDVPRALTASQCVASGLRIQLDRTSYFVGRETLLPTGRAKMAKWRKMLFAFVSRNARPATAYFGLPPNRVVELGMQIDF